VPEPSASILATHLIAINLLATAAFGIDKLKAAGGHRRMPESTLLLLALLGGSLGAYAGRAMFRHKTHKQPFSNNLHTIAGLQVVVLGLGLGRMLAR
jgi:uncharacterized membrane protein YsdA (DUF1294 family)